MSYQSFKNNSQKEYLGVDEDKGYIYSVPVDTNKYIIIAVKGNDITYLIEYTVKGVN